MAIYSDQEDPNHIMWNKQNEKEEVNQIVINKEHSFVEVWHEGYIESNGERHYFWLIDPQGVDPRGNEYAQEVRWFFARVPREVRVMYNSIIEAFKHYSLQSVILKHLTTFTLKCKIEAFNNIHFTV